MGSFHHSRIKSFIFPSFCFRSSIFANNSGGTIGGSVRQLSDSFGTLKGAFVNLVATALAPLIPYIVTVVQWLTGLFTTLAQIIAALFGMQQTVGSIASATTGGASKAKKAAKDATGALAAFDQINVLATQNQEEADTGGGAGGGLPTLPPTMVPPELLAKIEDLKQKLGKIKDLILEWWNDPIGKFSETWFGKFIVDLWTNAVSTYQRIFENTRETFTRIKDNIILAFNGVKEFLLGVFTGDWLRAWEGLKSIGIGLFGAFYEFIRGTLTNILIFLQGWGVVLHMIFGAALENIKILWSFAVEWFRANVTEPIKNAFYTSLDLIKSRFESVFNGIKLFVRGVANSVIDIMNAMIRAVVGGINAIIKGANAVAVLIPGSPQIALVNAPQIPRLATGAVIPPNAEFAAILGDQRSGRNIEAPENLIRQIVSEEIGKIQADVTINFAGSLAGLVRELKPFIDKENVRVGGSLVRGTASI